MTVTWLMPSATDYVEALQHPMITLSSPELRNATFRTDHFGMPAAVSGASAAVFHATVGREVRALRCFTGPLGNAALRYSALQEHRLHHRLDELTRAVWRDAELSLGGRRLPVVDMEWVEGVPLDVYVAEAARTDPHRLHTLADRWRELLLRLAAAEVAHGDLQHGNVLVTVAGTLRLVDFDGLWLPAVASLPPQESGHANYQHPERSRSGRWGRWVDAFAALSIYTSLRAVAEAPDLLDRFSTGDNLIFTAADFNDPGRTPVWRAVELLGGGAAQAAATLQACSVRGWRHDGTLEDLLLHPSAAPAASWPPKPPSVEPIDGLWPMTAVTPAAPAPSTPIPGRASNTAPPLTVDWSGWWDHVAQAPTPPSAPRPHAGPTSSPDRSDLVRAAALVAVLVALLVIFALLG